MCTIHNPRNVKNIKCNLSRILCKNISDGHRDLILSSIKEICVDISQMTVKASHLCKLMVEMMLSADWQRRIDGNSVIIDDNTCLEWPNFTKLRVFKDLLTVGSSEEENITPAVKYAWNKYKFNLLPDGYVIKRRFKDETFIKHCAITYQSTFLNVLRKRFTYRQRLAIEIFLKKYHRKNGYRYEIAPPEQLVYALQCLINRWQYRGRTYTPAQFESLRTLYHVDLIQKHWQHLPFQENITVYKLQPFEVLRYYYFLKKEYGHMSTKLRDFVLIPQNKVKIHHITFDTISIQCLRNEIDKKTYSICERGESDLGIELLLSKLLIEKEKEKEEENGTWQSIFDMEYISKIGKKSIFGKCITTNGQDCTIKYLKIKT